MRSSISFVLDGNVVTIDSSDWDRIPPTTTLLNYLRSLPTHQGTKRGCDEGDCGACTVAIGSPATDNTISYKAVDSCLIFLPMIHGKHLVTVENLKHADGALHPVQDAMVETHGSQCGFCTPGIVMSLFALQKNTPAASSLTRHDIEDTLTGNLCRCTGYEPIIKAAHCMHEGSGTNGVAAESAHALALLQSIPQETVAIETGRQRYYLPSNLNDALSLLRDHPNALILGGATDIALRVTKRYELLPEIIDLSHIEGLQTITAYSDRLEIGSGVVLQNVVPAVREHFPALHMMLSVFGSKQIRNLATLGGNLGTASPISDTLPVLMAYNATIVLESTAGKREIPMEQFILGYRKTARRPDEIITSIILPIPDARNGHDTVVRSYKISKRRHFDISTVSGGFRLERDAHNCVKSIKLAYGGMADRTKRWASAEQFLTGKEWNRQNVEHAMTFVSDEFQPLSDVRASAEMRLVAAKNLLLKFWAETQTEKTGARP